jgi:hypothetical protein
MLAWNSLILCVINGSHVPIIAPTVNPKSYYCQKGLYSTLIQRVIGAKCSFSDYDYGRACSIHDWVFFQKKFKKLNDEREVFTLQVDGKCYLSNATMNILSIQK